MSKNLYQSLELLPDASSEDIVHAINHARKYEKVNVKVLSAAEEHLLCDEKRALYDGYLVQVGQSGRQYVPENRAVSPTPVVVPKVKKVIKKAAINEQPIEKKAAKRKVNKSGEIDVGQVQEVEKVLEKQIIRVFEFPQSEQVIENAASQAGAPVIEFTPDDAWKCTPEPVRCCGCQQPLRARSLFCDRCGTKRGEVVASGYRFNVHNKKCTALLALFLGSFGAHKFYLGQVRQGVFYVLFLWTAIPLLLGLIEGFVFLNLSDEDFNQKYNFK